MALLRRDMATSLRAPLAAHQTLGSIFHLTENPVQATFLLGFEEKSVQPAPPPAQVDLPYIASSSHRATSSGTPMSGAARPSRAQ
jgi:hypothetical protein